MRFPGGRKLLTLKKLCFKGSYKLKVTKRKENRLESRQLKEQETYHRNDSINTDPDNPCMAQTMFMIWL